MGWIMNAKMHSNENHKIEFKFEGKNIAQQLWERFELEFDNITKFVDSYEDFGY